MANFSIPYTNAADYTFDSDKIEIDGGVVKLKKSVDILTNLKHRWGMNDNNATAIYVDDVGGFDLTLTGALTQDVSQVGLVDRAAFLFSNKFIYETDATTISNNLSWILNSTYSLVAVFNHEEGFSVTAFRGLLGNGNPDQPGFKLYIGSDGKIHFNTYNGGVIDEIISDNQIIAGDWYIVVATWDGITKKLFVNGVQQTQTSNNGNISDLYLGSNTSFTLSGYNTGTRWLGLRDYSMLFDKALNDDEITYLYNSGSGIEDITDNYYSDAPTIYKTTGNFVDPIQEWQTFSETVGSNNEGIIGYQLSNNGVDWSYWNGSSWTAATNEINIASVINANIITFPITNQTLYVRALLSSDGTQQVELDQNDVTYLDNIAPSVNAGTNKSAILNQTIQPFSDATFSDPDSGDSVVKAEYQIVGEIDTWTEIPQGAFGTLLEAVQSFQYTFSNIGSLTARLRVTDSNDATNTDNLTVSVAKTTATFNVLDASNGQDIPNITFNPGDGEDSIVVSSPFTYDYGLGDYQITLGNVDYNDQVENITISSANPTFNFTMNPLQGEPEVIEEININIDSTEVKVNLEVE